ncbi:protein shank-like isoform X2 [Oppia nitens]|nr:protein shank-like isoform X2 [Oppia nitens]
MKRSPDDCEQQTNKCQTNCDLNTNNNNNNNITNNVNDVQQKDLVYVNIYLPELQQEQTVIISKYESIWTLKRGLIERCNNLKNNDLNYGLFSTSFGHFLDEELNLNAYFSEAIQKCCNRIRLELLYKQRIKVGEVMSTLPAANTTRRRRKRSRLIQAVTNGNIEKVAKILINCDPNFVDETSGDTPLSIAASSQSASTSATQRIVVALVNGGSLLDFRTKDGRTALHCAVQKSNYVALKTLLDLGASPNYKDAAGLTPLCYTILNESNPKLTQLLLHEHSMIGVVDHHGWQEVHHACKLGLVAHLEQLLYYGCDMNCRIVGSGNTPLHVSAINDQIDCARVLLLRGCDTKIVNNSHQNAYQVAVIANNMSLAELIANHKPEMVVPYRDKPKYNPARRPPHSQEHTVGSQHSQQSDPSKYKSQINVPKSVLQVSATSGGQSLCPSSPSLSQRSYATSTTTTTTSSGVCCEDGSQSDGVNEEEIEVAEDVSDSESESDESSVRPVQLLPGMTVVAVIDYNSGDPTHLQLRRNDMILLLPNSSSPPTIANQKLLLGRRCVDGKEGLFPVCCVEKFKSRVEGRRDQKYSSTTLPARGRSSHKNYLKDGNTGTTSSSLGLFHERTVTLQKGSKGFGFVLRGAKATSPLLLEQNQSLIGLQYLDEIETGAVAEAAGLKRGDFLLAVNGNDVRHMSHEMVVQLIRQCGDRVTMTVATPIPQQKTKQFKSILKKDTDKAAKKQIHNQVIDDQPMSVSMTEDQNVDPNLLSTSLPPSEGRSLYAKSMTMQKFSTLPRNVGNNCSSSTSSRSTSRGRAPPAPPKRDPTTTLSIGRARARSLLIPNTSGPGAQNRGDTTGTGNDYDSEGRSTKSSSPTTSIESMIVNQKAGATNGNANVANKVASIRASRQTRRISSYELEEFFSRQTDDNDGHMKTFESMTALKKKKNKTQSLHKNFNSTPDIQKQLAEQLARNQIIQMSNSEEELFNNTGVYAQTVALKGGKIIPVSEISTNFDDDSGAQSRAPPPTYPPPPPPPPPNGQMQTSVIKLTLAKHSQSDYANYETVSQNQQMLSSFRPVVKQDDIKPSNDDTVQPKPPTKPLKNKAPAPPPGAQPIGPMKSVKQPNTSSTTTSVYTRQDTIEQLDEKLSQPQIPDPDYSTDEEHEVKQNRDMSTFRANNLKVRTNDKVDNQSIATSAGQRATQSFAEKLPKSAINSTTTTNKPQLAFGDELKAKTEKIMSKSMAVQSVKEETTLTKSYTLDRKGSEPKESDNSNSDSNNISKVRKNIREFERRSSICGETVIPSMQSSMTTSMTTTMTTTMTTASHHKRDIVDNSNVNNNNNNNNTVSDNSANNSIRMSKSCFEVDCCDNSSSGVSSDVDGEYGAKHEIKLQQMATNQQQMNRRNSQNVSEKIAVLMAATAQVSQVAAAAAAQSSIGSNATSSTSHTATPPPVPKLSQTLNSTGTTVSSASAHTRRATSCSDDSHKTKSKVWPNTGSQSVMGTLPATTSAATNIVPNLQQKAVKFTTNYSSNSEPKSNTTSDNYSSNVGQQQQLTTRYVTSQAKGGQPIRLQIDSLGLAAVNEVDVLAELVPPPPEFAAPPPGHSSANKTTAVGDQIRQPISNQQVLTRQQQQQLQQLRQQQLLQQQRRVQQPPPIPAHPPPATLPHQQHIHQQHLMTTNKEQIRIISPTPHQMITSTGTLHHSHPSQPPTAAQHYQRFHQQALEGRSANASTSSSAPTSHSEFTDLLARQRAAHMRSHQQHIDQQISASMRLGVNPNASHGLASHQQFSTLQRHSSGSHTCPQGLTSAQVSQAQQFATLTRHQSSTQQQQQRHNYCDYTRLTVQNRLMRHMNTSPQTVMSGNGLTQAPAYVVLPVVDWSCDDVHEWLKAIGMSEHIPKLQHFNGPKLMRLDNNGLLGQGIRQQQHRIYLLEKLKQQILKNHH